jgi:hypothetical protein
MGVGRLMVHFRKGIIDQFEICDGCQNQIPIGQNVIFIEGDYYEDIICQDCLKKMMELLK